MICRTGKFILRKIGIFGTTTFLMCIMRINCIPFQSKAKACWLSHIEISGEHSTLQNADPSQGESESKTVLVFI